ncbi:MAG: metal ABC transporter ATP-binding protein [Tissierellia bacterium]|nr:metal ABC transporter ATP-binding protein [Tissierellia bacterium]
MDSQPIIAIQDLCFSYGKNQVLRHVDLTIHRGEFAAIIGANGAGKSTLVKLILGELLPDSGSVRLFGQPPQDSKELDKIGYVPQTGLRNNAAFPANSLEIVYANLYTKTKNPFISKQPYRERAMEALRSVGMEGYADNRIGELSGGQLQRVLLARALVNDPELIILDEPTTGVDKEASQAFHQLLHELHRQKPITILTVTHNLSGVVDYIDRTFCVGEGYALELTKDQIHLELAHRHQHPPNRGQEEK